MNKQLFFSTAIALLAINIPLSAMHKNKKRSLESILEQEKPEVAVAPPAPAPASLEDLFDKAEHPSKPIPPSLARYEEYGDFWPVSLWQAKCPGEREQNWLRQNRFFRFSTLQLTPAHTITVEFEGKKHSRRYNEQRSYLKDLVVPATLHGAILSNNNDAVTAYLADPKINPNEKDEYGDTPAHYAAARHNLAILFALLERGASLQMEGADGATAMSMLDFFEKNRVDAKINQQKNDLEKAELAKLRTENALLKAAVEKAAQKPGKSKR